MSSMNIVDLLTNLDEKTDRLFIHQQIMSTYQSIPRDYGTGLYMSETEAHALLYIERNPGITAKRIAEIMYRTKSTISLVINFLDKNGLIIQEVNPENRRERNLYLTDKGRHTCEKHSAYDRKMTSDIIIKLLESCTQEEVNGFFKVIDLRMNYFQSVIEEEKEKLKTVKK